METVDLFKEEKQFIDIINNTYSKYFEYGPKSSKKVDYFHSSIKDILEKYFTNKNGFDIKLEYNVTSCNCSKKKKCDIVILKNKKPYIIFPVKIIMTNYKQNKYNYWETLTGELTHLKWAAANKNENIYIIPINIYMNRTPYLNKDKIITKFENITTSDIENYNELIKHNLCYDIINYIVEVEHKKETGEKFNEINPIKNFITPYRELNSILSKLL